MKKLFFILIIFLPIDCSSQKQTVPYSRDYEFKEGIFLTLNDFLMNTPIGKDVIVSDVPKTDLDFLHHITNSPFIIVRDSSNNKSKIETMSIWAYCQNRSIYLNYNATFNRLNVIGTLCHFTSLVTNYRGYSDPMNANFGINTNYDELKQFVLDTQTDKVLEFTVASMELLLKNDETLYLEFMKLKKRKKADSIFIYLRKYNEKHPLYLNTN